MEVLAWIFTVHSHEEQASPVAGNGHLKVELVQTVQDVQLLRSVQPLRSVFSDVLNGLNGLNVLNQAYPLSVLCVKLCPRTVNKLVGVSCCSSLILTGASPARVRRDGRQGRGHKPSVVPRNDPSAARPPEHHVQPTR